MSNLPLPSEGGSFAIPPAGMFPAILYRIIDLGTQAVTYAGETKDQHKVLFTWELHDEECTLPDGRPMTVSKRFTWSMHEKASLRAMLEAWRGKAYTDAELKAGVDVKTLLGQVCYISLVHAEGSNGNTYCNIKGVNKPPKGFQAPEQVNPSTLLWLNPQKFNRAVFDSLGDRLRADIEASPEYKRLNKTSNGSDERDPPPADPDPDFDEPVPF